MVAVQSLKPLGAITVFAVWVVIGLLLYKWPGTKDMSISRHAAANKKAYIVMAVFQTIDLPLFLLFTYKWFVPTYHLPQLFTITITLAILGLLIAAWIPDVAGVKRRIHEFSAYGAAALFVPATFLIYLSTNISLFARSVGLFTSVYMVACILSFIFYKKAMNYHLYLQSIYVLLFQLTILAAIYVS